MNQGELNLLWARTFVGELADSGVRTVVLAPGSRSTPLVLAADGHPDIETIVHLDERSAAFFALGVGKGLGLPAAVVTTSGTAVANLLPAVVEAAQSETPLLLLTADRPPRLRGTDANQTIRQDHIFGTYPVAFHDVGLPREAESGIEGLRGLAAGAVADSLGPPAGPVHLNFPFDEPLHPAAVDLTAAPIHGDTRSPVESRGPTTDLTQGLIESIRARIGATARGIVVAGPDTAGGVRSVAGGRSGPEALARLTGFPLLADPLSGARSHSVEVGVTRVAHYDLFLRDAAVRRALRPDLVLRSGRAPTSAALNRFVSEAGAEVMVLDEGGRWRDHTGAATSYVEVDPLGLSDALAAAGVVAADTTSVWSEKWGRSDDAARQAIEAELRQTPELPNGAVEPGVTRAAVRALPSGGILFASSSMPVRDVDAYLPAGGAWGCLGNRGASGIDGITSTALGSAFATKKPTLVLLGDLAFIHDMNGLIPAADLGCPVVLLVVNNRGGGIFHMLPIREVEPAFTRYFATPHRVNFRHAGGLYDLPFRRIASLEVEEAVAAAFAGGGTHILEVRTDREENRRWRADTVDAVRASVAGALELTESQPKPENR